jgi:uncharacterized membrane protein (UPF0127 family)
MISRFIKTFSIVAIFLSLFVFANNAFALSSTFFPNREHLSVIFPGQKSIDVAVSNTQAQRELGLGFVKKISDKNGMLFIFKKSDWYAFWMKDMYIPIDIIFIDESKVVTDVYKKVSPYSFPKIYHPSKKIKYVLEINSGNSSKLGIKPGQKIIFSK